MKNTNTMNKIANYIISASSLTTAQRRYNTLMTIARTLRRGDTFIHSDLSDSINYTTLSFMVSDIRVISLEKEHGSIIKDERGRTLGRTSCNVYRMDYDPDQLMQELRAARDIIMDMFK